MCLHVSPMEEQTINTAQQQGHTQALSGVRREICSVQRVESVTICHTPYFLQAHYFRKSMILQKVAQCLEFGSDCFVHV